ncbi:MAG: hypothetical protein AAB909_02175 [Patescibacteria group bacterium]
MEVPSSYEADEPIIPEFVRRPKRGDRAIVDLGWRHSDLSPALDTFPITEARDGRVVLGLGVGCTLTVGEEGVEIVIKAAGAKK